jgi:hypothetical protein
MIKHIKQFRDGQLLDLIGKLNWRIQNNEEDMVDLKTYEEIYNELHHRGIELPIY